MSSDATQFRRDFWTKYAELYPEDGVVPGWGRVYFWVPVELAGLNVSLGVYPWGVGLWLRGRKGESLAEAARRIQGFKDSFREVVSDAFDGKVQGNPVTEWIDVSGGFDAKLEFDVSDMDNWEDMAAWLHYMLLIYLRVIESKAAQSASV